MGMLHFQPQYFQEYPSFLKKIASDSHRKICPSPEQRAILSVPNDVFREPMFFLLAAKWKLYK